MPGASAVLVQSFAPASFFCMCHTYTYTHMHAHTCISAARHWCPPLWIAANFEGGDRDPVSRGPHQGGLPGCGL
eukprot:839704-Pelagomonas_calceolata.AAC.2